jgi:hypothetical protein
MRTTHSHSAFLQSSTLLILLTLPFLAPFHRTSDVGQIVYDPTSGHYYERVDLPGLSWDRARTAAEARIYQGLSGHLVTITSPRENAIVFSLGDIVAYHFGGYQERSAPDYHEPDRGWKWVTGEPWDYAAWSPGEPNDGPGYGEEYLVGWHGNGWNDGGGKSERGYVVEYEPARNQPPQQSDAPTLSSTSP